MQMILSALGNDGCFSLVNDQPFWSIALPGRLGLCVAITSW
jgi:hypothetical protein